LSVLESEIHLYMTTRSMALIRLGFLQFM
jgi:hypothetical protein